MAGGPKATRARLPDAQSLAEVVARFEAQSARTSHVTVAILVALALGFAGVRFLEAPGNPATLLRMFVSLIAAGFVIIAHRQSLLRRATIFVALEGIGGLIAFTYVGHQRQISDFALAVYDHIHAI
jgi:hypothetical protein